MKYVSLLVLILFVSLMLGCSNDLDLPDLPESYPDDFLVEYDWGACVGMWGRNNLKINSEGEAILVIENDMIFKDYYNYTLSSEEIRSIYEIIKNDFFKLQDSYPNEDVLDGSCSKLTVNADGKSHSVSVVNSKVEGFNRVTNRIIEVLENYHTSGYIINYEKLCNEAKTVCEESDSFENISCERYLGSCEDKLDQ